MTTNDRGADVALQDPLVWGDFRDALDILVWELRMEQFNHLFPGIFRFALICLDVNNSQTVETLETGFRCVFSLVFSALSNLFSLLWRWRATHHTPLQEFTRRLPFLFLCLWLVGTWYQCRSKDLGNWESMRPIFDGVLELYNGSLAHSATFDYHQTALVANLWYVHLALSQGDNSPMNLVLFNDALVMLIDWDIIWCLAMQMIMKLSACNTSWLLLQWILRRTCYVCTASFALLVVWLC